MQMKTFLRGDTYLSLVARRLSLVARRLSLAVVACRRRLPSSLAFASTCKQTHIHTH